MTSAQKRAADARARATPLDAVQQALVERWRPLVFKVVRRFNRGPRLWHLYDDLLGAGMVGLVRAAQGYDPALGCFQQYAEWHIVYQVYQEIDRLAAVVPLPSGYSRPSHVRRRKGRTQEKVARAMQAALDVYRLPALMEPSSPTAEVDEVDALEAVWRRVECALASLPLQRSRVLRAKLLEPEASCRELARRFRVSAARIHQHLSRGRKQLQAALADMEGTR